MSDLRGLEAVAKERGMVLAFRLCEDSEEVEPVFMRIEQDEADGAALLALSDRNGFSLGRYVVSRERLLAELARERSSEPTLVPADWQ